MMTLYSCAYCPYSHQCRILLHEKEIEAHIIDVDLNNKPPDLAQHNPYNQVPVLVDKELALYESAIINEYLNDRFPHPELLPTDIVQKAQVRLYILFFVRELYRRIDILMSKKPNASRKEKTRAEIVGNLKQLSVVFKESGSKYLLGPEFTLADITLAPLLWRLPHFDIELTRQQLPLLTYAQRVFARTSFNLSLTAVERVMRD